MRVAIVHPDLGLGGAERLIVDAAVGLRELGHEVKIYTAYFDPQRCFEELVEGDEQIRVPVQTIGGWIPRTLFGRMKV